MVLAGIVAAMIFVLYRCYNQLQPNSGDEVGNQVNATIAGREPLLSNKNNDHSSWDSSYDSIPSDGDQGLQEKILEGSVEGEVSREGEIHSPDTCRLCAICLDSPRDCFFLPCGHSAACFSCGSRQVFVIALCFTVLMLDNLPWCFQSNCQPDHTSFVHFAQLLSTSDWV